MSSRLVHVVANGRISFFFCLTNIPVYVFTYKQVAGQGWPVGPSLPTSILNKPPLSPCPLCSFPDCCATTNSPLSNSTAFVHAPIGQGSYQIALWGHLTCFPPAAFILDFRSEIRNFSKGQDLTPWVPSLLWSELISTAKRRPPLMPNQCSQMVQDARLTSPEETILSTPRPKPRSGQVILRVWGGPCTQPHSAQIFLQNQLVQPQTVFLCWTWHLLNNSELFFLNLILSENICVHLDTLLPSISLLSLMQLSDVLAQILGQIWVSLNRHQLYWCHEACHAQQEKWQLPYHQTSKPPD